MRKSSRPWHNFFFPVHNAASFRCAEQAKHEISRSCSDENQENSRYFLPACFAINRDIEYQGVKVEMVEPYMSGYI
jgi:hypothetical protein